MRTPLWTSEEAVRATSGRGVGQWKVYGISIDTRTIEPGDLFVALQDVRDGHDFVPMAYEKGAGASLVSRQIDDVPALQVDDTLTALEALGRAARRRTDAFCCAITGSVGKTSVKEMLAQIFRAHGEAHWSVKSFNNHWGVPLTLARMPAGTERAVFEIGMNTPGEIEPRSLMVKPHAALITKIAPAHLEGMGTEDAVALEKSAIFAGLLDNGFAILPRGDQFYDFLREKAIEQAPSARIMTFGTEDSQAFVTEYETDGVGSRFTLSVLGETVSVSVSAVGDHWGQNIAAALLMASCSGISAVDAAKALNGYAPPEGRGNAEWLNLPEGGKALMVDDAYNANPESMRAALAGFALRPAGRKLIALGEMKELGKDADSLHAELAGPVLSCSPASVFLSGEGIRPLADALSGKVEVHWAPKAGELQEMVNKSLITGDALLIKGSNASGMRILADALRSASAEHVEVLEGAKED
ncbi:UDP-N-acetylmuramoyl-tripeptide--D-alanyl-D-alanine ligase [Ponticaulis sp.]|uniref:UDP-N-acetylmuramoyl-tripeptide--D-alanyl-D- alanine ligase n=1 Tax=Ponticaulis sp. TaxID=2020902 RepID=UPI000B72A32D|nr:UDP-N-acetylmuramoyl-tripeptide--D-alanyl-D-alanine ligase [Ponticaulis sp.]MAI88994.1 UDP-N-acetylmuramoyl-tripeptide--D-alanyl-D-alanine ligase [Ponticaulis sp.]OUY01678.1 MAG: UDP-N-acetylmuramoyl-tripeptide--D-alanyl-D-alanine ligase [Hyphomonadaceae bacterium TMED5]|tara:strand:+ start:5474 stop:6886 length:1413 start_codon:yes stop_codon:yes gene_type:complete